MTSYRVKNWDKFQHYKDRRPPWIKLHRTLLDDCDFIKLPVASRALAPLIWLLASESDTGEVSCDISFRLRISQKEVDAGLSGLIASGYITRINDDSVTLADCKQHTRLETETERETEKESCAFFEFWKEYPRKVGKAAALKAWNNAKSKPCIEKIIEAIKKACLSDQWRKDNGQFIPHPATWLNQGRWDDDLNIKNIRPMGSNI
jgi:hypothetical protein